MKTKKVLILSKNSSQKKRQSFKLAANKRKDDAKENTYYTSILEAANNYISRGFQIVPLAPLSPKCNGKVPGKKKWPSTAFRPQDIISGGGVGIKTGVEMRDGTFFYAVDIDCGVNSEKYFTEILQKLSIKNPVYQKTISGGFHIFIRLDRSLSERVIKTDEGQIELKGKGRYIAVSPTHAMNRQKQPGIYLLEGDMEQIPFVDYEVIIGIFPDENIAAQLVDELSVLEDKDIRNALLTDSKSPGGKEYVCRLLNENRKLLKQHNTTEILDAFGVEYDEADEYVKLLCPFHEEAKPSFVIYKTNGHCADYHPDGKIYSLLDFLAEIHPDYREIIESEFKFNIKTYTTRFSKPSLGEVFQLPSCEYEFTQYISEHGDLLKQIITDDNHYEIISDTGSGKTESVIITAQTTGTPLILLLPLRSTVDQKAEKYGIPGITGKVTVSDFMVMAAEHKIFTGTYNSISKFVGSGLDMSQYTLVIDEAHCFCTQNGYRNKVLREVTDNLSAFKKVIRMTGTPEGVYSTVSPYQRIRFKRKDPSGLIGGYRIIAYSNKLRYRLMDHLTRYQADGRTVILYNHIKNLEKIRSYLIQSLGVPEDEIALIDASKQEDEDLVSIKQEERIKPETRYLLTTSVLGEGANILNEDIGAVYLADMKDVLSARQFVARFRKGVKNVYDFIPGQSAGKANYPDVEFLVQKNRHKAEQIVESKNLELKTKGIDVLKGFKTGEKADHYYSDRPNKFIIDESFIRYEALNEFNAMLFAYPENRKEYLTEYLCPGIEIVCPDKDEALSFNEVPVTYDDLILDVLSLLCDERNQLLFTYELKVKGANESKLKRKYKPGKSFDARKYYTEHYDLFSNKKVRDLIERYLEALDEYGFSKKLAYHICQLDTRSYNMFVYKVYTLIYYEYTKKFPSIESRHVPVIQRDIFGIIQNTQYFVHDHDYKNIDINELREYLIGILPGNEFIRNNSPKSITSFFFNMYKTKRKARKITTDQGKQKTDKNLYDALRQTRFDDLIEKFSKKHDYIEWDKDGLGKDLKQVIKAHIYRIRTTLSKKIS